MSKTQREPGTSLVARLSPFLHTYFFYLTPPSALISPPSIYATPLSTTRIVPRVPSILAITPIGNVSFVGMWP